MRFLNLLFFCSLFGLVFYSFFKPITAITQDLGRHLKVGEIVATTRSIPATNLFSYTNPSFPFINSHWLSEVIFYFVQNYVGLTGLLLIMSILAAISILLVFRLASKKGSPWAAFAIGLLYIFILLERTDLRPEIFSFLFFSIFLFILYKNNDAKTKLIYLLVPLQLLWVNIHIYFIFGPLLTAIFFTNRAVKLKNVESFIKEPLLKIFILQLAVSLLNPSGINGLLYPFTVLNNYGYSIAENQNLFFLWEYSHSLRILLFAIANLFLFVFLVYKRKKLTISDWLLCIFFTIIPITAIRHLPLFVLATWIPFSIAISTSFPHLEYRRYTKQAGIFLLIFVFIWEFFYIHTLHLKQPAINASKAVYFFLEKKLTGPIFNNFDIGSYLIYRLYPQEKVFVDGRPEAYPASFFQEVYIPMQQDPSLLEKIDKKYHFNTIFFSHTDQTPWSNAFLTQLFNDDKWQIVYLDDYAVIFVRKNDKNSSLIAKKTDDILSSALYDKKNEASIIQLLSFYKKIGVKKHEKRLLIELIQLKPNKCLALLSYAQILLEENDPAARIYFGKYQAICK